MKEKIKNTVKYLYKKTKGIITNIFGKISTKIKLSFDKCKNGEEKLNNLLIYWCIIPCIIYLFLIRMLDCKIVLDLLDLVIFILIIFDFYFIEKTLKIHPEYNTELMREVEKQNFYKTLNEEQLKEQKLKEAKENRKYFIKRFFSYKSKEKCDFYKLVKYFLLLIFLLAIKRIFL